MVAVKGRLLLQRRMLTGRRQDERQKLHCGAVAAAGALARLATANNSPAGPRPPGELARLLRSGALLPRLNVYPMILVTQ